MGSVRKASAWLGLVDDSEGEGERYYEDEYTDRPESRDAWVTDPHRAVSGAAEERGYRIATITPDGFRDARAIGELFRDGVPVIINLTSLELADAKRVIDFAAGLTFGLRGNIERVARGVFLLTPADYSIVDAASARGGDGFYNQS